MSSQRSMIGTVTTVGESELIGEPYASVPMEFGITTFAEVTPDPRTGTSISPERRLAEVIAEARLADELRLDVYGVGEHHRPDFAVSAPAVVLAAAAQATERIRLSSAVTVLSSDDPVRVFQDFATLDLLSGGRAEIMAGRGSFTESFPLFGQSLDDYDELFAEKLGLLLALRGDAPVTWSGHHRPALRDAVAHPRPLQHPLPVWVAVGGSADSVVRAATLGLPLVIAIIGGAPERFVPLVELYRATLAETGQDAHLPVAINTHGFLAPTTAAALATFTGPYVAAMSRIGRERGWPPMSAQQFEALRAPRGALTIGTTEEVAEKLLFQHELFGHDRHLLHLSVGTMPHADVLRAIELFGTEVAPLVRAEVARRTAGAPTKRA
jgi:probable LLM family oxidoreductase